MTNPEYIKQLAEDISAIDNLNDMWNFEDEMYLLGIGIFVGAVVLVTILSITMKEEIKITDARLDEMSWYEVKEIVSILPTD